MSRWYHRLLPEDLVADPRRRGGYWLFVAHVVTVFGIALSNLFYGLLGVWLIARRRQLTASWSELVPLARPLLVYVAIGLVATLASLDPLASADDLKGVLALATLLFAPLVVRGEADVSRALSWMIGTITSLSIFGLVQYALGDYGSLDRRIPGPFSHYMTFAGVLQVGALLLVARLLTGGYKRPLNWLSLALITWTLLLTLTRGAWVALAVTMLAFVVARARRYLPLIVAAALVLVFLAPGSWRERMRSIGDLHDFSNYDRLCMADAAFYMIDERPLFGIGPGMVKVRYPIYRQPTAPRSTVPHLHNTFLGLAAETGLLSLGAYLWLIGTSLWLAYRGYRDGGGSRGPHAALYLGVMMAVVGFNVGGLFEDNWSDTEVQRLILFLLAAPLCLAAATTSPPVRPLEAEATPPRGDSDDG
ncbi:MAG: hypothetical protein HC897_03965 [Thermoanaerobaculia bacterium]|nr:hypothetical protein [Thermoanaerobaculia bacterium]